MPLPEPDETEKQTPLFRRIEEDLRQRIEQGIWPEGQALPSRSRLCEEFGTTRVTLDKAIQELVRAGLLHSAKGSGTFVLRPSPKEAPAPRPLRLGIVVDRSTTLGTATSEEVWSDNFYFGPLFQGVRDGLVSRPVETLYANLKCTEYAEFYRKSELDGMILVTPSRKDFPILRELAASGVNFVAVGVSSSDPQDASLPCVDTDNIRGASEAVRHLLSLGHRQIGIVNLATEHANHHDRQTGCRRAMDAAGIALLPENQILFSHYSATHFEDMIEAWVLRVKSSGNLPTALFACDYLMSLTTLRVLRRHDLRVPEDISLVSFDDPLSAAHLTPALTTVRQPVYRLGRRAAQRLLHALSEGSRPHGVEILPTELIIRDSTRRLSAASTPERALVTS